MREVNILFRKDATFIHLTLMKYKFFLPCKLWPKTMRFAYEEILVSVEDRSSLQFLDFLLQRLYSCFRN